MSSGLLHMSAESTCAFLDRASLYDFSGTRAGLFLLLVTQHRSRKMNSSLHGRSSTNSLAETDLCHGNQHRTHFLNHQTRHSCGC